jgi:hypothetical protein
VYLTTSRIGAKYLAFIASVFRKIKKAHLDWRTSNSIKKESWEKHCNSGMIISLPYLLHLTTARGICSQMATY